MIRTFFVSRLLPLGSLVFVLGQAGCATPSNGALRDLKKRVAELSRSQKESQARQEELENRLLLLTDQLESLKVEQTRAGTAELPVVTLRPHGPLAPRPAEEGASVEFSGPARSEQPDKIRPLLRAEGAFAESVTDPARHPPPPTPQMEARRAQPVVAHSRRQRSSPTPAPAAAAIPPSTQDGVDNLGVMPIPRSPGAEERARLGLAPPAPKTSQPSEPAPTISPPPLTRDGASSSEATRLYNVAYGHVKTGRFDDAERDLREFVRRFPRHDYADNAQYWLGETYYARKSYTDAAAAFRAVVERWPAGNKAPDALLKLGYSLILLGEAQKGKAVLSQVVVHYPNTESARLAQQRLGEMTKDAK